MATGNASDRLLQITAVQLDFCFMCADVCNADLSLYSPHCIASVLKKFLRELPDPVIPVQWYDRFLEASSEYLFGKTEYRASPRDGGSRTRSRPIVISDASFSAFATYSRTSLPQLDREPTSLPDHEYAQLLVVHCVFYHFSLLSFFVL